MIASVSSLSAYSRVQTFAVQAAKTAAPSTVTFAQSASLSSAPSATTSFSNAALAKLAAESGTRPTSEMSARSAITPEEQATAEKMTAIKAVSSKGGEISPEDRAYLWANDPNLQDIDRRKAAGQFCTLADNIYVRELFGDEIRAKAAGTPLIILSDYLSDSENEMCDELASQGNEAALEAMFWIAFTRQGSSQTIQTPDGGSFAPQKTAITVENINKFFRKMIVDPSGRTDKAFDALITYLTPKEAAKTSGSASV